MPITIQNNKLRIRNAEGNYVNIDAVSDATVAERLTEINTAAQTQISAIEQKGVDTVASIPSDYTELSDEVSDLKSAFTSLDETVNGQISKNYIEGKNFTANSSSHSIIDDADACISDYIPVTWGTDQVTFWYTDDSQDDKIYQIWFFDSEKNYLWFVGRNSTGTNYRNISIPSQATGAQYARISFKKGFAGKVTEKSLTPSTIYYTATDTITAFGLVQKVGNLSNLKTEEKTDIVRSVNEIVDEITGRKSTLTTAITSGAVNSYVDFSAVTGEKVYVLPSGTAFKNSQCYIYFRYAGDSSNTNMGLVDLGKKTYFTLEKDLVMAYVYASANDSQAGTVNFIVGVDGIEDAIEKNTQDINVLKGKKINFLGDSLTHGPGNDNINSYTTFLANEYGCTTRNYGIIGSTIQYDEDRNPMCVRYADMDNDADIVAFMGGTNDYWNNKPLGQFGDTTYDTFYGALDVLISGLIAKYPTAFVYAVTPPHGYGPNFTGETKTNAGSMQDIADAVKQVAAKYSILVLDVFNAGGLYPKISAQADVYYNSSDGVHLTVAGQKRLANLHATFIKAHYCG